MENLDKKVSVIIPAYNEEKFIEKSLRRYKDQNYPLEIIVVVNNSDDKTYEIAKKYTDKVLNFDKKIGLSRARNEGAKIAEGEILIFSDADSWIEKGGVKIIVDEFNKNENIVSSIFGKGEKGDIKGKLIFFLKNNVSRFGIHHGGIAGVIVCSKKIFLKTGGFSGEAEPAEQKDFFRKAEKCGANFKLIKNVFAHTSMRRYEQNRYVKTITFWILWRILSLLRADENFKKNYFKTKNEQ